MANWVGWGWGGERGRLKRAWNKAQLSSKPINVEKEHNKEVSFLGVLKMKQSCWNPRIKQNAEQTCQLCIAWFPPHYNMTNPYSAKQMANACIKCQNSDIEVWPQTVQMLQVSEQYTVSDEHFLLCHSYSQCVISESLPVTSLTKMVLVVFLVSLDFLFGREQIVSLAFRVWNNQCVDCHFIHNRRKNTCKATG